MAAVKSQNVSTDTVSASIDSLFSVNGPEPGLDEVLRTLQSLLPVLPLQGDHLPLPVGARMLHSHQCDNCFNAFAHEHVIAERAIPQVLCEGCTAGTPSGLPPLHGSPAARQHTAGSCLRDVLTTLSIVSDAPPFATPADVDRLADELHLAITILAPGVVSHHGNYRGDTLTIHCCPTKGGQDGELHAYTAAFAAPALYPDETQGFFTSIGELWGRARPAPRRPKEGPKLPPSPAPPPRMSDHEALVLLLDASPLNARALPPAKLAELVQRHARQAPTKSYVPIPAGRPEAVPKRRSNRNQMRSGDLTQWHAGDYERKSATGYQAARFMSAEIPHPKDELSLALGEVTSAQKIMQQLEDWVTHDGILPRRFGDHTAMRQTKSAGILTLSGANFTEGDTIYIFTSTLQANRGVYAVSLAPGATAITAASLVGVVVPQIDAEEIGALINVVGCRLAVGIQQSTGASSSVKAFSNVFEWGVAASAPYSARPGKLAYVAAGGHAMQSMMTDGTAIVADHTACVPDNLVRLGNDFDAQSDNVRIPGDYSAPAPAASLEGGERFRISAYGGADATVNIQQGIEMVENNVYNAETFTIFTLSKHASALRHPLMGGFTFTIAGPSQSGLAASATNSYTLTTTFIDGSSVVYDHSLTTQLLYDANTLAFSWTFDGAGTPALKEGTIITDIVLTCICEGNANVKFIANQLSITVDFHNVSAASRYPCVVITGAKEGQTISIDQSACCEIKVDPTGNVGRYVSVDHDFIPDNDMVAQIVRAMRRRGIAFLYNSEGGKVDFRAGAFGDKIKHFFGGVLKTLRPFVAPIATAFGGPMAGKIADGVAGVGERLLAADIRPRRSKAKWGAATYKANHARVPTGFQFPLVSDDGSTGMVSDVCLGEGRQPAFIAPLREKLCSAPDDYTGLSNGLAFLLAGLELRGAPCRAGLYSGVVESLRVAAHSCTFVLLPVDLSPEKRALYDDRQLTICTPKGFYEFGLQHELADSAMLASFRNVHVSPVRPPPGYPGHEEHTALAPLGNCNLVSLVW